MNNLKIKRINNNFILKDKWQKVKLKDVAQIICGQSPESEFYNLDKEGLPFYQGKTEFSDFFIQEPKIYTKKITKEALKNDILMSVRAPVGDVNICNLEKICIGRGLASIRVNSGMSNLFLFYYLKGVKNIIIGNTGTTFESITKAELEKIEILLPPLAEQEKIVSILSKQDEVIEKLEDLIKLKVKQKKGLMQKLLSGKVRLKGFDGEWKEVKLGDILEQKTTRNNKNIARVLSINNKKGFILPEEQFSKEVASNDLTKYKIVEKNDFAYNPARINVGSIARLDKYNYGIVSPMYAVFRCKNITSDYIKYWILTDYFNKEIKLLQQGSVRSVVDFKNLSCIKIKIPVSIEEQSAIASILSKCDKEIELLKQKLELNKKQKKWLMQKLLSGEIRVDI